MTEPEKKGKKVKDSVELGAENSAVNIENALAEEALRLRSTLPKTIEELEAIIANFTEKHPELAEGRQEEFDGWRALYK